MFYTVFILSLLIREDIVEGAVQLECDSLQCLSQEYQYQCNVTGSSALLWRIRDENMVVLDDQTYTSGSAPSFNLDILGDAPEFSTRLNATSPSLISYIAFTVQSNINGYTIECDSLIVGSDTCPIVLADIPSVPEGITIHTDTFTNSSVNISWNESSSSPCVTGYRYNVSSTAPDWVNIIVESTSNNVTAEGLVPSYDQYCIVVSAIDTASRNSSDSDPACFIFNVPPSVNITDIHVTAGSNVNEVVIKVNWETKDFDISQYSTFPPLTNIQVSIAGDGGDVSYDRLLSSTTTSHMFTNVPKGRNYTITVVAINGVGNTSDTDIFKVPELYPTPTYFTFHDQFTSQSTVKNSCLLSCTQFQTTGTSSATVTITTSNPLVASCGSENSGLSSSVFAGISVAITVPVTAVITVIITVTMLYLCGYLRVRSHKATPPSHQEYDFPFSVDVEMKGNAAYGQVSHTPSVTTTTAQQYDTVYM